MPRENPIPTLDGWRGIAILMVLSEHFVIGFVKHRFFGSEFLQLGQHGVTIFFRSKRLPDHLKSACPRAD